MECPKSELARWAERIRERSGERKPRRDRITFVTRKDPVTPASWKRIRDESPEKKCDIFPQKPVRLGRKAIATAAEDQARQARIVSTRQRAKELLKDPEFVASLRSSCITGKALSEEDADLLKRLNEGEFRREANIRLYGREFENSSEDRNSE
jgi:hypothetical protein